VADICVDISRLYKGNANIVESQKWLIRARSLFSRISPHTVKSLIKFFLYSSTFYASINDYESAERSLEDAFKLFKNNPGIDVKEIIEGYKIALEVYDTLGNTAKKQEILDVIFNLGVQHDVKYARFCL
jgi:hypothetical protein